MLVQLPPIFRAGYKYFFPKLLWTSRVKEMVRLSLPRIFGMSVTQISLIVDTVIASLLPVGSIAVINFAVNLESIPIGVVGISVAVASFGHLSEHIAKKDMAMFVHQLQTSMHRILMLLIPLAAGMFILREPFVRLILQRGKFSGDDAALTAHVFGLFLAGLVFGGVVFLLARGFYAMKNTKIPVAVGVSAILVNIILSFLLTRMWHFNVAGLAMANSVADVINGSLLYILLSKKIGRQIANWSEVFKFIIAAAVMAAAVRSAILYFNSDIAKLALGAAAGAGVYFGLCYILRCKTVRL